jgi:hypothetical protein
MRALVWAVLLLLALASAVRAAPDAGAPSMPDPCIEAPNLPFCR